MDSFEANKIFGAVLGTVFVVFGGSLLAEGLYHSETPETEGYAIVAAEAPAAGEGGGEAAAAVPVATLLASADAERGAAQFRKCQACHAGEEGGANKVGPALYNVVNRPIGSHEGFAYSAGMTAFAEGGAVTWDFEHLNGFIADPKGYVSGTSMGFAGISDDADRADLLAYLRSLSASPAPLPEAAPAEAAAAPAEGAAAPADAAAAPAEGEAAPAEAAAAPAEGEAAPAEAAAAPAPDPAAAPAEQSAVSAAPAAEEPAAAPAVAPAAAEAPASAAPAPAAPAPAAPPAAAPAAPAPAPAAPASPAPAAPAAAPAPASPAPAAPPAAPAAPAAAPAAAAPAAEPVSATGDAVAGAQAFRKCQACHAVGEGAANKIGPELNGIVGEAPGAVEGYTFSPALMKFATANPVWNEANLTEWLTNPRQLVPGTKMVFPGIRNPEEIANIIAHLKTFDESGATVAPAQ